MAQIGYGSLSGGRVDFISSEKDIAAQQIKRRAEIDDAMEELGTQMVAMSKAIDELVLRLSPVLVPEPAKTSGSEMSRSYGSALGGRIGNEAQALRNATQSIVNLIDSLAI